MWISLAKHTSKYLRFHLDFMPTDFLQHKDLFVWLHWKSLQCSNGKTVLVTHKEKHLDFSKSFLLIYLFWEHLLLIFFSFWSAVWIWMYTFSYYLYSIVFSITLLGETAETVLGKNWPFRWLINEWFMRMLLQDMNPQCTAWLPVVLGVSKRNVLHKDRHLIVKMMSAVFNNPSIKCLSKQNQILVSVR